MERDSGLLELAADYWACRDIDSLLKVFTTRVGTRLDAHTVLVWLLDDAKENLLCRSCWFEAGMRLEPGVASVSKGFLMEILEVSRPLCLREGEIGPTMHLHLKKDDRERVETALYASIRHPTGVEGVVEVLNKRSGEFTTEDASFVPRTAVGFLSSAHCHG